jgi:hypothetical protein
MLLALRMCEIGTLVCVESETETAFEGAKVVAENVRVLRRSVKKQKGRREYQELYLCEIYSLESELPKALTSVDGGF